MGSHREDARNIEETAGERHVGALGRAEARMFFFATTFTVLSEWSRTRYRSLGRAIISCVDIDTYRYIYR